MSGAYKFAPSLRELRFLFCQTSEASSTLRQFLTKNYPPMKKANPNTPILLREASGTEPRVWVRYEMGKEKNESLAGLSDKEIRDRVKGMVQLSQTQVES